MRHAAIVVDDLALNFCEKRPPHPASWNVIEYRSASTRVNRSRTPAFPAVANAPNTPVRNTMLPEGGILFGWFSVLHEKLKPAGSLNVAFQTTGALSSNNTCRIFHFRSALVSKFSCQVIWQHSPDVVANDRQRVEPGQ
eukprot:SAG11_NODE_5447_length_1557_cov_2.490398_1_plen_139_part_00